MECEGSSSGGVRPVVAQAVPPVLVPPDCPPVVLCFLSEKIHIHDSHLSQSASDWSCQIVLISGPQCRLGDMMCVSEPSTV